MKSFQFLMIYPDAVLFMYEGEDLVKEVFIWSVPWDAIAANNKISLRASLLIFSSC